MCLLRHYHIIISSKASQYHGFPEVHKVESTHCRKAECSDISGRSRKRFEASTDSHASFPERAKVNWLAIYGCRFIQLDSEIM
jgi:hypothetical protein